MLDCLNEWWMKMVRSSLFFVLGSHQNLSASGGRRWAREKREIRQKDGGQAEDGRKDGMLERRKEVMIFNNQKTNNKKQ
jgi:hypothetical protein